VSTDVNQDLDEPRSDGPAGGTVQRVALSRVAREWTRIGLTGFGGPPVGGWWVAALGPPGSVRMGAKGAER
jgi:hypothetical protein